MRFLKKKMLVMTKNINNYKKKIIKIMREFNKEKIVINI